MRLECIGTDHEDEKENENSNCERMRYAIGLYWQIKFS
jgi:hypothetical protein